MKLIFSLPLMALALDAYAFCSYPNNSYDDPYQQELAIEQYNDCVEREQRQAEIERENERIRMEMQRQSQERMESITNSQESSYGILN